MQHIQHTKERRETQTKNDYLLHRAICLQALRGAWEKVSNKERSEKVRGKEQEADGEREEKHGNLLFVLCKA